MYKYLISGGVYKISDTPKEEKAVNILFGWRSELVEFPLFL